MRILDWIVGREPVATATGIAAVVTAALGVGAAFGLDVTAEQIGAIGALAAALAGWLSRRVVTPVYPPPAALEVSHPTDTVEGDSRINGSVPLALIILVALAVVFMAGLAVCTDALFEDEDEVNDIGFRLELVSHDYECVSHDCGDPGRDEYDGNRAGISPGPFDRSPVDFRDNCISLDCSGRRQPDEAWNQSLFPPSADAIRAFVLSTIQAGIAMGRLFAETTITFVSNLLVGIA